MLAAFKHGLEYTPYDNPYEDVDPKMIPVKCRPFWEWLRIRDQKIIQPPPNVSLKDMRGIHGYRVG